MRLALAWFVGASMAMSCGGKTTVDGSSSSSSGSGGQTSSTTPASSTTSSTSSGGACTSLVPCCDQATGAEVEFLCEDGTPYCPPGASFSQTGTCDPNPSTPCLDPYSCPPGFWCEFPDDACGQGQLGQCLPGPIGCDDIYQPTCTCDGFVAGNACEGQSAGFDQSVLGNCMPPAGTFVCGSGFCDLGVQYCERQISDVVNFPDLFTCLPLPPGCGNTATCGCLDSVPCGFDCSELGGGAVQVTCPGG